MELHDAEQLALRLMKEFGLASTWRFEFDNARRRFGCCHHRSHLISLSREIVLRNGQPQVEDTIRHEIAHALCPARVGHGYEWKQMCLKVGANPERCYDGEVVDAPKGDWQATCGVCHKVHHKFRRPRRELWCADKKCKRMIVPYIPGHEGGLHPARKLVWRNVNAPFDPTIYATQTLGVREISAGHLTATTEAKRAGVDYVKEQLRKKGEMERMKERIAQLEQELGK